MRCLSLQQTIKKAGEANLNLFHILTFRTTKIWKAKKILEYTPIQIDVYFPVFSAFHTADFIVRNSLKCFQYRRLTCPNLVQIALPTPDIFGRGLLRFNTTQKISEAGIKHIMVTCFMGCIENQIKSGNDNRSQNEPFLIARNKIAKRCCSKHNNGKHNYTVNVGQKCASCIMVIAASQAVKFEGFKFTSQLVGRGGVTGGWLIGGAVVGFDLLFHLLNPCILEFVLSCIWWQRMNMCRPVVAGLHNISTYNLIYSFLFFGGGLVTLGGETGGERWKNTVASSSLPFTFDDFTEGALLPTTLPGRWVSALPAIIFVALEFFGFLSTAPLLDVFFVFLVFLSFFCAISLYQFSNTGIIFSYNFPYNIIGVKICLAYNDPINTPNSSNLTAIDTLELVLEATIYDRAESFSLVIMCQTFIILGEFKRLEVHVNALLSERGGS